MYVCLCMCVCARVCVCMCVCACVFVCTYMYGLYIHTHRHQCCARFLWQIYNRSFFFHEVNCLIQSARYNASHNRPLDCTLNTLPSSITFIKSKCLTWPSASFSQSVHQRWRQECEEAAVGTFAQWWLWNFIFNDKKERRWNIAGLKKDQTP